MPARRIAVLGAGIIGVTTAYALAARGADVTLIDAALVPATGASGANGAQLSYSYVAPLADPAVLGDLPHYLFDSTSPLRFRPRLDPAQWDFCVRFLLACRRDVADETTAVLLRLAARSRDSLHALMAQTGIAFDHNRAGKLVVFGTAGSLANARKQVELQAGLGSVQEVIDADRAIAIEPALATIRARIAGAVLTPSEEAGDCAEFCRALCNWLQPQVRMRFGVRVQGIETRGDTVVAVKTDQGSIECDDCVVALGSDSAALLAMHGIRVPVYPLKGYSITARIADLARAPAVSVTDLANKTVYARLGDRLRVAGFVEIVGHSREIDESRIGQLVDATEAIFPGAIDRASIEPWAGLRPATPTSRPIVGPTRLRGLWTNIGHGALGWTLSCGAADELVDHMYGQSRASPLN
ncbi:D-amino acid dehydrogenase [soil metagenome]